MPGFSSVVKKTNQREGGREGGGEGDTMLLPGVTHNRCSGFSSKT